MDHAPKNHIISYRRIREFLESHPEMEPARPALARWYRIAKRADWRNFAKVRETFGDADAVGDLIVFNIAGNKVRLIAEVRYNLKPRKIYLRHVLTHVEYDRGDWKE